MAIAIYSCMGLKKKKGNLFSLFEFFSLLCPQIQRGIAYEKTSNEVSAWKNIILRNQKAEQMVFPLNQESSGPKPVEQVVARWKVWIFIDWNRSYLSWFSLCH